jgi:hypothetical protein
MLKKITEEEEKFVLVQGFRGFSPWSLGPIVLGLR